jgi:ATPase subunit of ABC transporter with duplicated ATPase domains
MPCLWESSFCAIVLAFESDLQWRWWSDADCQNRVSANFKMHDNPVNPCPDYRVYLASKGKPRATRGIAMPETVALAAAVSWSSPTGQPVLDRVTLALGREKTGLVGSNGSGKTTLARILAGELAPTSGSVSRAGIIALLPQEFTPLADQLVAEALGVQGKLAAMSRLGAGEGLPGDLETLNDDWSLEARIGAELHRLGLDHVSLDRPLGTLSGGETTRIALAALFLQCPDLIILDEPTNNLDGESRQALYGAVAEWAGGLLVISHDRRLLGLMERIVELSPHGLRHYGGNFEVYTAQRDAEAAAAQQQLHHAAKELRKTRRQAQAVRERQEKRGSHGKKTADKTGLPKMAINARRQSGERTAARLAGTFEARTGVATEAVVAAKDRVAQQRELDIALTPVELPAGKTVLELEDVSFRFAAGNAPILENFNLRLVGPERLAIVGPNGSGKSTLLKLILGELQPTVGRVQLGIARVNCLDQKAGLLDPQRSVLENFQTWSPGLSETVCRLTLARFLFRTDDVHRLCGALSGGERLRAALACVLTGVNPPQCLLLDEPTNHLDLASLTNLEQALCQYTGALVVVSHDRTFLENIGVSRIVELRNQAIDKA